MTAADSPDLPRFTYRVIEVSPVDDQTLETAVNASAASGWLLDRVEFVQELGVRRPVMAFVFMRRPTSAAASSQDDP